MREPRAAVSLSPIGRRRARPRLDSAVLATNLSFVLHERSTSQAVDDLVRACQRHATLAAALPPAAAIPSTLAGDLEPSTTQWLSALIGLPHLFLNALGARGASGPHTLVRLDARDGPLAEHHFFRAPASLALSGRLSGTVGVGALVLRPDNATTQLVVRGVYAWPAERNLALRAVEYLIQTYADQWLPERALWSVPAEALLPSEIG